MAGVSLVSEEYHKKQVKVIDSMKVDQDSIKAFIAQEEKKQAACFLTH
jgi:hypothetical protein